MLTPVAAAEELLRRRKARTDLTAWAEICGSIPAAHHKLIISYLEKVTRGEIKRLAVFLPPGAAKSTYCSMYFAPWWLAQRPNTAILCASHSASLATRFGRVCRNLVDKHENILGYSLSKDSQAAEEWETSHNSRYFCAGVGGKIAGHRADLGLIDDPIGSVKDADSLVHRDSVWAWYEWDFLPRLKPNASIVIISTRWHEDDLMGRILAKDKERGENRWTILELPMEATKTNDPLGRKIGERLWPEWFTQEMVDEAKSNPRKWQGAYQQNPNPEDGDFFKKEWFVGYTPQQLPASLSIYAASDHACSGKESDNADSTLLVPFGVDEGGNIWILPDIFWDTVDTGVVVDKMIDLMKSREPISWAAETEHIVKSIGPFLKTRMIEEEIYTTYLVNLSGTKDKPSKARSIQGRMQMRKVFFPTFASWWPKAENELLTFPVGKHDEFPDVLGVIGRYLDGLGKPVKKTEKKVENAFTMAWLKKAQARRELEIDSLMSY
jgi:hypothetical protein